MSENAFLNRIGVENPIILAPMSGGMCTPELIAAVSNAGGLGSAGVAYFTPQQIIDLVRQTRTLTQRPINLNLFAGGFGSPPKHNPTHMLSILNEIHAELGLAAPAVPAHLRDPFPEQFEAVLEARPEVFSFTFGVPGAAEIARLRSKHIAILGTATTVEEGHILADAGVDAVVAQGAEAGGHRGTFAASFEASMVSTMKLTHELSGFVPVIASGGIMDGRDIQRAFDSGASAVQLGTAFLPCPESGANKEYKRALLSAKSDETVITRAFSGRPARGLRNEFITRLENSEDAILPYPLQNALTRPMRNAAAEQNNAAFLSLWAGQGVTRCRAMPAGELVRTLIREWREVSSESRSRT
jgi:nitronate monooxygenase